MKDSASPQPTVGPSGPRVGAIVVLVAGFAALSASLLSGEWDSGRGPVPYAWRDVALVHALCAVPLAVMLAAFLRARLSRTALVALAAGCLAAGVAPFTEGARESLRSALVAEPWTGPAIRPLPALAWALAGALALAVLIRVPRPAARPPLAWRSAVALGVLGGAALVFPPATYVGARCRHDVERLGELLGQSRVGEAHALAHGLLVLDAGREWNGHPMSEVAARIEQVVKELEASVAVPMREFATTRDRIERARRLAMLGRTGEALGVLSPVDDPRWTPEVETLRGTIRETRGEWDEGLTAYRAARAAWEARPPSGARAAGVQQAVAGVAYCLRKSGRYAEAEAAYQELLALAPTAETHFLLARFYEDAQQAAKAREHARRAIEMAPERYAKDGEKLIKQLTLNQFGCYGVFDAEGRGSSADPEGGLLRIR